MSFDATILTLYPEMFPGPLGVSLSGDALARGVWSLTADELRIELARAVDREPA